MGPRPLESQSSGRPMSGEDFARKVSLLVGEIWEQAVRLESVEQYLAQLMPRLAEAVGAEFLALVVAEQGRWEVLSSSGCRRLLPEPLLGAAFEQERVHTDGQHWVVVPMSTREEPLAALVGFFPQGMSEWVQELLHQVSQAFYQAWRRICKFQRALQRVDRLQTLLHITTRWNQTQELETLLVQIAEAATRLMNCERASIFLWDRANRTLVARPALGMPEGELRIPDDRGVVGRVLRSGQPIRADDHCHPDWIDHQVDASTGYRTRSVLAVPLRSRSGEIFGVFELLNKRQGRFSQEDELGVEELAAQAAIALENIRDRQELMSAQRRLAEAAREGAELLGQSPAIQAIRASIQRIAQTDLPVLILGENGTGKEVVARAIHFHSPRREKPFVAVNCAAIPDTLAESELFGHEKGAFTDAHQARPGKFELAADGTLFLDEIGDLSVNIQAKLLRVLEEKVIVRVGGSRPIPVAARVIAATNQNLPDLVQARRFREDLFYRLNVVCLQLPPLRDRPGDIILLAEHFLREFCRRARRPVPRFSAEARRRLENHSWPGNVRELRNLMERLAYLGPSDVIEAADLSFMLSASPRDALAVESNLPLAEATDRFQAEYIRRCIERVGGNMKLAAEQLGLHRSNLYRKMRQLGMLKQVDSDE
ncbi:MAG: sigma-54-dependent Fis family transcriptional regulator [Thermoguttaceae bacterium]|nr:sigma-54-dependent Fis family transcriptional regulator [Thermoguttaceae bacterium]MDW8039549.1 sigma-54-dependent Fis family transcriptional regulator [Thermoguttaceae bacterium]